ncbi:MAG: two component transcriptional regulator, winged helix family, partial [candidate division NC10 bacterium]|nr:two component transcriptional regulator, winged helix family [candidate division NC10 bacterium]
MLQARETQAGAIRILVVDDDLYARQAMMEGLQSRGYEVRGADDGLQALQHLQQERFDLVITDIQMPRMDGVALLREICRNDYAPVIVQTTLVDG